MTDSTDTPATVLDRRDEIAIVQQFSHMPYGVNAYAKLAGARQTPMTVDDVVDALAELRKALQGVGERSETAERELRELQSQRRALRLFIGTES